MPQWWPQRHRLHLKHCYTSSSKMFFYGSINSCLQCTVEPFPSHTSLISTVQNCTLRHTFCIEAHITTAVNKIISNIFNSLEQLVFPIMTQLHFLHLPGSIMYEIATFARISFTWSGVTPRACTIPSHSWAGPSPSWERDRDSNTTFNHTFELLPILTKELVLAKCINRDCLAALHSSTVLPYTSTRSCLFWQTHTSTSEGWVQPCTIADDSYMAGFQLGGFEQAPH